MTLPNNETGIFTVTLLLVIVISKVVYSHFKLGCQIESVLTSPSLIPCKAFFTKPNRSPSRFLDG